MSADPVDALGPPDPAWLECRYEALRRAALGEQVSPECRNGLALFLRRGMWGWSRALTTDPARDPRPQRFSLSMSEPDQHTVVVRLFAAMTMVRKERKQR